MFKNNKNFSLEKYQKIRKGKISLFGISADFDWLMLNFLSLVLIILVFVFSVNKINNILNYQPELDSEYQNIFKNDKTMKDLDNIIKSFESKNDSNLIDEDVSE